MLIVNVEDATARAALERLEEAGLNMLPVYRDIGEQLLNSTQERFRTSTDPEGKQWEPNAQATYLALLGSRHEQKDGRINQRGVNAVVSKKPLIGELGWNGGLADQIHYDADSHGVEIGSSKPYAAMMQFGGTKAEFPHLWGDIPARAFLGLSHEDSEDILALAVDHLVRAAGV